jgi:hypothetical protein
MNSLFDVAISKRNISLSVTLLVCCLSWCNLEISFVLLFYSFWIIKGNLNSSLYVFSVIDKVNFFFLELLLCFFFFGFFHIFFLLLFICAYKAWVISSPCPHPLPYHPLHPLSLPPTPSIPQKLFCPYF